MDEKISRFESLGSLFIKENDNLSSVLLLLKTADLNPRIVLNHYLGRKQTFPCEIVLLKFKFRVCHFLLSSGLESLGLTIQECHDMCVKFLCFMCIPILGNLDISEEGSFLKNVNKSSTEKILLADDKVFTDKIINSILLPRIEENEMYFTLLFQIVFCDFMNPIQTESYQKYEEQLLEHLLDFGIQNWSYSRWTRICFEKLIFPTLVKKGKTEFFKRLWSRMSVISETQTNLYFFIITACFGTFYEILPEIVMSDEHFFKLLLQSLRKDEKRDEKKLGIRILKQVIKHSSSSSKTTMEMKEEEESEGENENEEEEEEEREKKKKKKKKKILFRSDSDFWMKWLLVFETLENSTAVHIIRPVWEENFVFLMCHPAAFTLSDWLFSLVLKGLGHISTSISLLVIKNFLGTYQSVFEKRKEKKKKKKKIQEEEEEEEVDNELVIPFTEEQVVHIVFTYVRKTKHFTKHRMDKSLFEFFSNYERRRNLRNIHSELTKKYLLEYATCEKVSFIPILSTMFSLFVDMGYKNSLTISEYLPIFEGIHWKHVKNQVKFVIHKLERMMVGCFISGISSPNSVEEMKGLMGLFTSLRPGTLTPKLIERCGNWLFSKDKSNEILIQYIHQFLKNYEMTEKGQSLSFIDLEACRKVALGIQMCPSDKQNHVFSKSNLYEKIKGLNDPYSSITKPKMVFFLLYFSMFGDRERLVGEISHSVGILKRFSFGYLRSMEEVCDFIIRFFKMKKKKNDYTDDEEEVSVMFIKKMCKFVCKMKFLSSYVSKKSEELGKLFSDVSNKLLILSRRFMEQKEQDFEFMKGLIFFNEYGKYIVVNEVEEEKKKKKHELWTKIFSEVFLNMEISHRMFISHKTSLLAYKKPIFIVAKYKIYSHMFKVMDDSNMIPPKKLFSLVEELLEVIGLIPVELISIPLSLLCHPLMISICQKIYFGSTVAKSEEFSNLVEIMYQQVYQKSNLYSENLFFFKSFIYRICVYDFSSSSLFFEEEEQEGEEKEEVVVVESSQQVREIRIRIVTEYIKRAVTRRFEKSVLSFSYELFHHLQADLYGKFDPSLIALPASSSPPPSLALSVSDIGSSFLGLYNVVCDYLSNEHYIFLQKKLAEQNNTTTIEDEDVDFEDKYAVIFHLDGISRMILNMGLQPPLSNIEKKNDNQEKERKKKTINEKLVLSLIRQIFDLLYEKREEHPVINQRLHHERVKSLQLLLYLMGILHYLNDGGDRDDEGTRQQIRELVVEKIIGLEPYYQNMDRTVVRLFGHSLVYLSLVYPKEVYPALIKQMRIPGLNPNFTVMILMVIGNVMLNLDYNVLKMIEGEKEEEEEMKEQHNIRDLFATVMYFSQSHHQTVRTTAQSILLGLFQLVEEENEYSRKLEEGMKSKSIPPTLLLIQETVNFLKGNITAKYYVDKYGRFFFTNVQKEMTVPLKIFHRPLGTHVEEVLIHTQLPKHFLDILTNKEWNGDETILTSFFGKRTGRVRPRVFHSKLISAVLLPSSVKMRLRGERLDVEKLFEMNFDVNPNSVKNMRMKKAAKVQKRVEREKREKNERDQTEFSYQTKIAPWEDMEEDDLYQYNNLSHKYDHIKRNRKEVIVCATFVENCPNLGGLCRTSEIFGLEKLVVGKKSMTRKREFTSLSVTSQKWLNIEEVKEIDLISYLEKVKTEGYTLIGIEQTNNSVSLEEFVFPEKFLLLIGKEKKGIPFEYLNLLDVCVEIPQFGVVRSLNVHVATSIVIYEFRRQLLKKKD